jgi:hypothetical protein
MARRLIRGERAKVVHRDLLLDNTKLYPGGFLTMKIEDLIAGKSEHVEITIEGISIPVSALLNLMKDGYVHLKLYKENNTFSLWGKNCTACFTEQQLRERV